MIDVCLLGTGGMMPLDYRYLTSLLVRVNGKMILIDCGEGTQIPFRKVGWGVANLDAILFTHFHADHIAGLPGLLLTLQNAGRKEPLFLVGPSGLESVVKSLLVIAKNLTYELVFVTTSSNEFPIKLGQLDVDYLYVDHNVSCVAYSLKLDRAGKFDVKKAKENNVPLKAWNLLQKGEEVSVDGKKFTPDMVLGKERKGLKLSYCTDTRPIKGIEDFVAGSDLFVCEGMYGDNELFEKACDKKHMTFSEAANLAKDAFVSELWLTHFSPSMNCPWEYSHVAKSIFKNTVIAKDLIKKTLVFPEEE